mmetsp:Transcript_16257/g.33467  ORF Transcript_16257/g.33467 Transcript_16257/m.33467 type:complete len:255 (-) Transcript_16257:54-818(-)
MKSCTCIIWIIVILSLLKFSEGRGYSRDNLLVINETNVNEIVKGVGDEGLLISFYAPACEFCKAFAEEWIKAVDYEEPIPDVKFGVIDCVQNQMLCKYWGMTEVPHVKLLKQKVFYTYNGDRTHEDLLEFAKGDYLRAPKDDLPRGIDYKAIKEALDTKKQKRANAKEELFDIGSWLSADPSSGSSIAIALGIIIVFIMISYCCAPSVESEESDEKQNTKEESKDEKKKDDKETKTKENESKEKKSKNQKKERK